MTDLEKAKILIEAIPYFQRFTSKSMVIKLGGSVLEKEELRRRLIQDVVLLKSVGINPIVVHGGGKQISSFLKRLGKENRFVDGLRVTDKETMELTQMVLSGQVNKELVNLVHQNGGKAVGISGLDGQMIVAEKKRSKMDYGFVGEISQVNPELINILEDSHFIPIISTIGGDTNGTVYNINADHVAMQIAIRLKAEKLIYLTDIDGVLQDINNPSSLIKQIYHSDIAKLIKEKVVSAGMIPKLQSSAAAISQGVKNIHILNGAKEHSVILEILTQSGVGTIIKGRL